MKYLSTQRFLASKAPLVATLVVACGFIGSANQSFAASGTWRATAGNGNWFNASTNWSVATVGSTTNANNGDTATFDGSGSGNTQPLITIGGNGATLVNIKSFAFTTGTTSYTIGSAGANAGNTLFLSNAGSIVFNALTSGTGLTQTFNAPISWQGPVGGTTNATYAFTNNVADTASTLVFAGDISGAPSATGTATTAVLTLNGTNTGNNTISSVISNGAGTTGTTALPFTSVTKTQAGTWILSGQNTYSGGTTVSGGTLGIGSSSVGTVTSGPIGTGTLSWATATISAVGGARTLANPITTINGNNYTVGGANNLTFSGNLSWNGSQTIFNNNTAITTFSGNVSMRNDGLIANRGMTIGGTGETRLTGNILNGSTTNGTLTYTNTNVNGTTVSGNNNYSGTTTISAGALVKIGNSNSLGYGGVTQGLNFNPNTTVSAGGSLDLNGQTSVNEVINLNGVGVSSAGALINNSVTPASIGDGLANLTVTATGSGFTSLPSITVTGGGATASAASLGVTAANINLLTGGSLYTGNATGTVTGGSGNSATVTGVVVGGVVTSITTNNPGFGYLPGETLTVTFNTPAGGTAATATVDATTLGLSALNITASGSGYTSAPVVTVTGGGGTGATVGASVSVLNLGTASNIGGSGDITVNSQITGGAIGLTKVGAGKVTLNGTTTYTGATTINAGTVQLGAADRLANTSTMSLSGGTFNTGGFNETLGALSLGSNSVIDLANGASILNFANSSGATWAGGAILSIYNWTGTPFVGGGTDRIFFGNSAAGLAGGQVAQVLFYSGAGTGLIGGGQILSTGELVAVPEPEYAVGVMALLGGLIFLRNRRRNFCA